jgi:TonB family protein
MMSHMSPYSGSSLDATERRQHARHQVKSLAYLDIGPDNGGIVLNISEGGLAVHAVSVLLPEPEIALRIQLPRSTKRLEARAKVAWTTGSKKDAGVEFIDLPEEARLEIREWLSAENAPEPAYIERPSQMETTPARKLRTDKWTTLVGEYAGPAAPTVKHYEVRDGIQDEARLETPHEVPHEVPLKTQHALLEAVPEAGLEKEQSDSPRNSPIPKPAQSEVPPPTSPPESASIVASAGPAIENSESAFTIAEPTAESLTDSSAEIARDPESKFGWHAGSEFEPTVESNVESKFDSKFESTIESGSGLNVESNVRLKFEPDAVANIPPILEGGHKSGTASALESSVESHSEPEIAPPAASPETNPDSGGPSRTLNAELSLPSDTLLNAPPQPFTVVTGGGHKSKSPTRSRFLEDSDRNAQPADEFLRKARALFGPKRETRTESQTPDLRSIFESAPAPDVEAASSNENAAHLEAVPAPETQTADDPVSPSDPPLVDVPMPVPTESVSSRTVEPILRSEAARTDRNPVSGSQRAARGVPLRNPLGVLALCIIVAVVCVSLGIALGRIVFPPAPQQVASTSSGISPQVSSPTPSNSQNTVTPSLSAPRDSSSHNRSHSQLDRPERGRPSRPVPTSSRRANTETPDSTSAAAAERNSRAATTEPENDKRTAAAAEPPAKSNTVAVPVTVSPASAVAPTPSIDPRAGAPAAGDIAPRTQPPPERLVAAHLVYRVEPFYPKEAQQQRVEGTVRIRATVDQDGKVKNLRIVSGPGLLTSAAMDAAQYWRYIPALRNGSPVESEEEISVEFHLPH